MHPVAAGRNLTQRRRVERDLDDEARAAFDLLVDACLQDIRDALRLLRRNLIFSITASLSLAIGIGATTTIFTAVNGLP